MSEGRALTNAIGNATATMVIAKWQGELDEERFHRVLKEPGLVDEATERALRGADVTEEREEEPPVDGRRRFDRQREREPAGI